MKSAIDELVGDNEIGWLVLFLQGANCRDGENALHSEFLEGVDIGPEVQLRREDAVTATVAREERNPVSFQFAENEWVRWIPKGRFDAFFVDVGKSGHRVKPAAADNPDLRLRQCRSDRQAKSSPV